MALLLLSARARDEIENRVREELLVELLTLAQADRTGLIRRARLLDVDLDQDWIVLVAQPSSGVVTRAVRGCTAHGSYRESHRCHRTRLRTSGDACCSRTGFRSAGVPAIRS
ncbi:MAG: hypothetical protein QOI25_3001 [Mycobacterium sp.]|nr:hypothetical protein [Mycobacterium sp.]